MLLIKYRNRICRNHQRRTRKERNAEKSETVQDGTTNTDSESVTLDADTYFYVPADDNYVMKHKG